MNFYPKRTRCASCSKRLHNCSKLPFHQMPVHRRDGIDVIVICTEYRQLNHQDSLKDKTPRWRAD